MVQRDLQHVGVDPSLQPVGLAIFEGRLDDPVVALHFADDAMALFRLDMPHSKALVLVAVLPLLVLGLCKVKNIPIFFNHRRKILELTDRQRSELLPKISLGLATPNWLCVEHLRDNMSYVQRRHNFVDHVNTLLQRLHLINWIIFRLVLHDLREAELLHAPSQVNNTLL